MFRKQISILIAVCMLLASFPCYGAEASQAAAVQKIQAEFFVAPTGDDENGGSYDHPFATLQAARDAVRKMNSNMIGDIYVFIASGNYYVNEPITFDERDSGTNGFDVVYRDLDGLGSAKFIGGYQVTSTWNKVTRTGADADLPIVADGSVYKTYVGTKTNFNTLYVNDTRATMARTKNLNVDPRFPASSTTYMRSAGGGISTLVYNASDLDSESLNGLLNAQTRGDLDAQVYMWDGGYWDWMTDTIPLASIDTSKRTLTYKTVPGNPAAYRPKYSTGSNARYFLQGNLGFLDQPGEYYFNKKTGYLYYYPLAGSGDIQGQDIVVPVVEKIIDIKGASRTSMVSHITFSGLAFKDTNFPDYYSYGWNWGDAGAGLGYYPPEAAGSTQPSYAEQTERVEFQVGVITLTNTNNITISKAHIKNAGMFGIELYLANQYTMIKDSLIEYTGHGGVNIEGGYPGVGGDANGDGYSNHNTVTNTIVHDVGQLVGQTQGVMIMNSGYNTISHLEIYNSPRRGIFISAGWSRNPNVAFPNGDKNFNMMTDMYSHHNTFEYIYLHDMQQDGGDDGAFFACYLYQGQTNYKPNYINQMVIDNVGANPSMTDIAPNGMNLDMGTSGFELRNVKIVNPQHFNFEVGGYNAKYTLTNTNIDFGTAYNQVATFNDSLMDYANIGVGIDFPSVYLPARNSLQEPNNNYFKDDFENGIDLSKWSYKGTMPAITTEWMSEGVLNGKQALKINSDGAASGSKPVLYRDFGGKLSKMVTVKLFDRQNSNQAPYDSGTTIPTTVKSLARADNGVQAVGLGLDTTVNNNYYVVLNGSTETATSVPRTYGWHELKWDYTSGTDVKLYIDGVLVQTLNTVTDFNHVELGSADGKGVSYYDQLYIYGGTDAPDPGLVSAPPAPPYDSSNDNKVQLDLDFENSVVPNFDLYGAGKPVLSVIADPTNSSNKVLQTVINDGNSFYQTDAPWTNYIVNMKWKFVGWGSNNVLNQQYDNFTIYVMTHGTPPSNPSSYQVIYRRNKLGTTGFPAGTPYFEISRHNPGDTSLGKVAVPSGFNMAEWHNFQIQTYGGKVGFAVDGTTLLSVNDGGFTSGGVAFGGINSTVLMDDFKIISNPTYVDYGTKFNLGNIALSGEINPTWFLYEAAVSDISQPVTLIKPRPILAGTQVKVMLNGVDITDRFADYTTATALPKLKNGRNTLVLSEVSSAGTKSYTIYIDKAYTISSVATIDPLTVHVGTVPTLPAATNVTFKDGTSEMTSIKWDVVKPSQVKTTGTFTVTGHLVGLNATVSTMVNVEGLESIGKLEDVTTMASTAPVLAATITAQFTNESKELPLTFAEFDPAMYAKAGTIIAVANADPYASGVLQKVTVLPASTKPQSTLTGSHQVAPGQAFDVKMGLSSVTQSVYQLYAQDLTLHYDAVNLQFDSVTSLKDGFQLIDQKEVMPGHVRIVAASVGSNQGVLAQGDMLKFNFTAKSVTQATYSVVSVSNVVIANEQGDELQVNGASHELQIVVSSEVDKTLLSASITSAQAKYDAAVEGNGDGLYVAGSRAQLKSAIDAAKAVADDAKATQQQVDRAKDALEAAVQIFDSKRMSADVNGQGGITIGDLAIAAAAYGKQEGQPGWNPRADVNKDGIVGIEDLAIIARAILK
ncbi:cohesin domain-containing protein [Paenibacillus terrigena]|uniref:cohesin domain-containing protein n=1 Tax=Paenibacillus terrigena TaxID=369333 RepID=UPI0028D24500|nr:cohesin domain-containing protein [Paenibacillus terrigena]